MEVNFVIGYYPQNNGYAAVTPEGIQLHDIHHCKEVFARRIQNVQAGVKDKKSVVHFLRKDKRTKSPSLAKHQEKVLHAFERAMDIEPLATVQPVAFVRPPQPWAPRGTEPTTEYYFLYTVSAKWRKNLPVAHILALITRNYYPRGRRMDWRSILKWLKERDVVESDVKKTISEIIRADGVVDNSIENNGISDYAAKLKLKRLGKKAWAR